MQVETTQNSVILVPENNWEREALTKLKQQGVHKMSFDDEWEGNGRLHLKGMTDEEFWGR